MLTIMAFSYMLTVFVVTEFNSWDDKHQSTANAVKPKVVKTGAEYQSLNEECRKCQHFLNDVKKSAQDCHGILNMLLYLLTLTALMIADKFTFIEEVKLNPKSRSFRPYHKMFKLAFLYHFSEEQTKKIYAIANNSLIQFNS